MAEMIIKNNSTEKKYDFAENPCIVYTHTYSIEPDMNMRWDHSFSSCRVLGDDRAIIDVSSETEADEIRKSMFRNAKGLRYKHIQSVGTYSFTDTYVREDHWEEYGAYRKRGRSSYTIIAMMASCAVLL